MNFLDLLVYRIPLNMDMMSYYIYCKKYFYIFNTEREQDVRTSAVNCINRITSTASVVSNSIHNSSTDELLILEHDRLIRSLISSVVDRIHIPPMLKPS